LQVLGKYFKLAWRVGVVDGASMEVWWWRDRSLEEVREEAKIASEDRLDKTTQPHKRLTKADVAKPPKNP
jgi:hypothetical protein